jgi:hypothetical protein
MNYFKRYYIELILLLLYFFVILPWGLSQPNDLVTIVSFLSLALVIYLVIGEGYKIYKTIKEKK